MTNIILKIVLFGDGAVGKTTLRYRYMGKGFKTNLLPTIGADWALFNTKIENKNVKFQIWDLAGQPSQKNVRKTFYKGAVGGVAVFDVTRRKSFENLPEWLSECFNNNNLGIVPIVVLGNKVDLRDQAPKCVQEDEGRTFSEKLTRKWRKEGLTASYFDTSAKTGVNVIEAFEALGRAILERYG
ncbi:MAG: Rab family GTPase [Candidatus Hodarchaeota archaeon]